MKNSSLYKQLYIHYCALPQLTAVSGQIPYQNYYDIKTFQCHARLSIPSFLKSLEYLKPINLDFQSCCQLEINHIS